MIPYCNLNLCIVASVAIITVQAIIVLSHVYIATLAHMPTADYTHIIYLCSIIISACYRQIINPIGIGRTYVIFVYQYLRFVFLNYQVPQVLTSQFCSPIRILANVALNFPIKKTISIMFKSLQDLQNIKYSCITNFEVGLCYHRSASKNYKKIF